MAKKNDDRFIFHYFQPGGLTKEKVQIIVDRVTGVQYVWTAGYQCAGLTVLLGADGKPLLYQPPTE